MECVRRATWPGPSRTGISCEGSGRCRDTKAGRTSCRLLLSRRRLGCGLLLFLLSRAVGFRLLLCLVLLISFRRFVTHDEKGSSCNPQSQRGESKVTSDQIEAERAKGEERGARS